MRFYTNPREPLSAELEFQSTGVSELGSVEWI